MPTSPTKCYQRTNRSAAAVRAAGIDGRHSGVARSGKRRGNKALEIGRSQAGMRRAPGENAITARARRSRGCCAAAVSRGGPGGERQSFCHYEWSHPERCRRWTSRSCRGSCERATTSLPIAPTISQAVASATATYDAEVYHRTCAMGLEGRAVVSLAYVARSLAAASPSGAGYARMAPEVGTAA